MPLQGSENAFAAALKTAAKFTDGDSDKAWERLAASIIQHITQNAVITGTTPNGGPLMDGKVT